MTCDFTSCSTVLQLYQDDCKVMDDKRLYAMEPRLRSERFLPQAGLEPGTGQLLNLLSYRGSCRFMKPVEQIHFTYLRDIVYYF